MSAKANHFKIGIFVLAGVALLVAGFVAFGARNYFQAKDTFETAVAGDVGGLAIGSRVELRGVPVGQVTKISFGWNQHATSTNRFIIVEFQVERNILPREGGADLDTVLAINIANGLRVMVKAQSITGTSMLALEYLNPAKNPLPDIDFMPGHHYVPSAPGQFTQIINAVEKTLHNLEQLDFRAVSDNLTNTLTKLADKLDQLDLGQLGGNANSLITEVKATNLKLQNTLDDLRRTIAGMKLETVGTNANSLISEVKTTNVKLQLTLDDLRQTIAGMRLDTVGTNANQLLTGLRESNEKLQRVLVTVGTIPLQETVSDVRQSFETLNQVLLELKQYPTGFLFGRRPPPAQSVKPASKPKP